MFFLKPHQQKKKPPVHPAEIQQQSEHRLYPQGYLSMSKSIPMKENNVEYFF